MSEPDCSAPVDGVLRYEPLEVVLELTVISLVERTPFPPYPPRLFIICISTGKPVVFSVPTELLTAIGVNTLVPLSGTFIGPRRMAM